MSSDSLDIPATVDEESRAAAGTESSTAPRMQRLSGPGLGEAILWLIAFFALQIGTLIVVIIVLTVFGQFEDGVDPLSLPPVLQAATMGVPLLGTYAVLVPLGWWRMSPGTASRLNLSAPSVSQMLIVASLVGPLTVISDALYQGAESWLLERFDEHPLWEVLSEMSVQDYLRSMAEVPLWLLIPGIACIPALGEEFLFRGLLGKGLISRWGVAAGVLLTSLLFGFVHLYPPHAIAAVLMGVVFHIVYLATGRFWLPVLIHFLNNALAALMLHAEVEEEAATNPLWLQGIAGLYLMVGIWWLWRQNSAATVAADQQPGEDAWGEAGTTDRSTDWLIRLPTVIAAVMVAGEIALIVRALWN